MPIVWDIPLVLLSVLLAMVGSLTALAHAERMRMSSGRTARIWLVVGAITLGAAIWSMHFIGLLAFHLPIPIGYDLSLTVVSVLPAVAAALLAFSVLRQPNITIRRIALSSLLMGVGISTMHYTGMAAIRMSPPFNYNPLSVTASIVVACVAALGALLMMYRGEQVKVSPLTRIMLGGAIMGLAISGMHYTSMVGLQFMPGSVCLSYASGIGRDVPAMMVSLVSLLWFGGGIYAALFDQRMARQSAQALARLEQTHLALQARTNDLTEQEELLRSITNAAQDAVILIDQAGRVSYWNPAAAHMFGYAESEVIGQNLHDLLTPERYLAMAHEGFSRFAHSGSGPLIGQTRQVQAKRRSGEEFPVEISLSAAKLRGQWNSVGIVRDVSERVKAEELLRSQSAHLAEAQRLAHIGSWELDLPSGKLNWSDEIFRLFEIDKDQFGATYEAFLNAIHPDDRGSVNQAFSDSLVKRQPYEIIHRLRMGDGRIKWVHERGMSDYDAAGKPTRSAGTVQDITERKVAEEEIQRLAFYDPLTNLPNRRLLVDRCSQALRACVRRKNHGAVLFLDLDRFKVLNDTKGHDVGDMLLIEVARRLLSCVRAEDTVARMGGDEFVAILQELSPEAPVAMEQAKAVAEKIRVALDSPYVLSGYTHNSSPSIGICLFNGSDKSVNKLLMHADRAMYQAKAAGRNTVRVFDDGMKSALTIDDPASRATF